MITLTILLFKIIFALATGIFKFVFVLGGVMLEVLLMGAVFTAIGVYGFGILLILDIFFLITKIISKEVWNEKYQKYNS